MTKLKVFAFVLAVILAAKAVPAQAVAIDDSITPQTCERTDPGCAQFLETTSRGQIKWGGLVAGGLRSLTNLFVDGRLGVGTLRPSTGQQRLIADVEGALGARFYCDENGNNCVPGSQLGTGSSTVISSSVTGGNGIIVNQSGNTYNVAIDPAKTQVRVSGTCPAGQAIQTVNQDGTVSCGTITGGGTTNITSGPSIVVNRSTTTNAYILTVNPDVVQFRINNSCPVGQAIRGIAANGTLTCQAAGGEAGDALWARIAEGSNSIYNVTNGKVVIGSNVAAPALLTVRQPAGFSGVPDFSIAQFLSVDGRTQATIGKNGNGLEAFSRETNSSGVYGYTDGLNSTAIVGLANAANGDSYGARLVGKKTGTYAKGNIGLYATDMDHAATQSNSGRDNLIPSALLSSIKQWAGYFDGDVNINGNLDVKGEIKVNGQPIGTSGSSNNTYKPGEHCGVFAYGAADGFNTNIACQGTYLFKFWQRPGVPSTDANMNSRNSWQCPSGFSLAGGDFQSEGNRYFLTCVKN